MTFVKIGKIHSAQGIKGKLFVLIFAGEAHWADQWEILFSSDREGEHPDRETPIESFKPHSKQKKWGFMVDIKGVTDRTEAEKWVGREVFVPESFLTSEEGEEIYLREVLGFEVIDQTRGSVGEVIGFAGNDFQDLLIIKGEEGEFEVPFVEPLLIEIDKNKKQIAMDIPQGLVAGEEL